MTTSVACSPMSVVHVVFHKSEMYKDIEDFLINLEV